MKKKPKLFYRYINGKMTSKETIDKLTKEGKVYQTAEEMSELMNESFRSVFSVEMDFTEPYSEVQQRGMQEVSVQRQKR